MLCICVAFQNTESNHLIISVTLHKLGRRTQRHPHRLAQRTDSSLFETIIFILSILQMSPSFSHWPLPTSPGFQHVNIYAFMHISSFVNFCPLPLPSENRQSVACFHVSVAILFSSLDSTSEWDHGILVFFWLASFSWTLVGSLPLDRHLIYSAHHRKSSQMAMLQNSATV